MICKYLNKEKGICDYLTEHVDRNGFHIELGFCVHACNNGKNKEKFANRKRVKEPTTQKPDKKPCSSCGKVKNIVKGLSRLVWSRIAGEKPDDQVIARSEVCSSCEHRTFLSAGEWAIGAVQSKDLPINHEPGDWDALWCSKCKCCIEAKIRVKDEKCPLDRWPD